MQSVKLRLGYIAIRMNNSVTFDIVYVESKMAACKSGWTYL